MPAMTNQHKPKKNAAKVTFLVNCSENFVLFQDSLQLIPPGKRLAEKTVRPASFGLRISWGQVLSFAHS
jgi:hypothetical protein